MYRVIIADDEPMIRKYLRDSVEWDRMELELAGEASNGQDALLLIEEVKPKILITDIKMPVMDGLELIKEIHRRHLKIKIIIISGYSDYEFLKEAIRFSVDSYLLKPIDDDELTSILASLANDIERDICDDMKQREGLELLRRNTLNRLLSGSIHPRELKEKIEMLGLSFPGDRFAAAVVSMRGYMDHLFPDREEQVDISGIYNICSEVLEESGMGIIFPDLRGFPVMILNNVCGCLNQDSIQPWIHKMVLSAEHCLKKEIIIEVGRCVDSIEELHISYDTALKSLYGKSDIQDVRVAENQSRVINRTVRETIAYIKEHFSEDITLKQAANNLYMNVAYLGQIFRKETGESFTEYVNRCRIEKAKELLATSSLKVYEVVARVGFTDLPYFIRIFKKYTGKNPSDVKKI